MILGGKFQGDTERNANMLFWKNHLKNTQQHSCDESINDLDVLLANLRNVQEKIEFTEQKIKEIETPPHIEYGEQEEFLYTLGTVIDRRFRPQDLFNRDRDKLKQFALYLLAACDCGEEYKELKNTLNRLKRQETDIKASLHIR